MMPIKNILFDLGGVIMNIKRENAVVALTEIGVENANRLLGDYVQDGIFLQLEEGNISPEKFHDAIRGEIPDAKRGEVSDAAIDNAFMKFLTGIPVHRLKALERLHEKYRLYMLSNTNIIMWEGDIKKCFEEDGHDVNYYFDGIVTSFEAHCVKPGKRIFEYAIEKLGIVPGETLFLDDSQDNVATARDLGFNAIHVPTDTEFEKLFQ